MEVRHDGVDVLADPGTFCYHGEPQWRSYFRSTLGHNTLELGGRTSRCPAGRSCGPGTRSRRCSTVHTPDEGASRWSAAHDGYAPAAHRRTVELDGGELKIVDEVLRGAGTDFRLAFHFGPDVRVVLDGHRARLSWERDGERRTASLVLPESVTWTAHRGEQDPPLGWYSAGFGRREPATTLVGAGTAASGETLTTLLGFES